MEVTCTDKVVALSQDQVQQATALTDFQQEFPGQPFPSHYKFTANILQQTFALEGNDNLVECLKCADYLDHQQAIKHFAQKVTQLEKVPHHLRKYIEAFQLPPKELLDNEHLLYVRLDLEPELLTQQGTYIENCRTQYFVASCLEKNCCCALDLYLRLVPTPKQEVLDGCLVASARNGHLEVVRLLLDRGANVHAFDNVALRNAALHGHLEVVRLLLDRGANIHAFNYIALRWAAGNGHLEVIKLLLDRGANVHASDGWAANNGHLEVVRLLLDRGVNVHASDDAALRSAAQHGHLEVVRLLLDRGANVHASDDLALRNAALGGHLEVVRLLLDRGANVHAFDDVALRNAALRGYLEVSLDCDECLFTD